MVSLHVIHRCSGNTKYSMNYLVSGHGNVARRIASHRFPQVSVKVDDHIIIEVLLILIRHPSYRPANVARALRGHIPPITTEQVNEVFSRYDLEEIGKKKGATVS